METPSEGLKCVRKTEEKVETSVFRVRHISVLKSQNPVFYIEEPDGRYIYRGYSMYDLFLYVYTLCTIIECSRKK